MGKKDVTQLLCDFLANKKISEVRWRKMSPADWARLVERALRYKVSALLYQGMKAGSIPLDCVPDGIMHSLQGVYRSQATQNSTLFFDASRVLKTFIDHQLPVIALKGLALAKSLYGDIALRTMTDMDLLVKEEDLVKAGRILLAIGYDQAFPAWEKTLKSHHHLPPFTSKNGTVLELHWNIISLHSNLAVDVGGLWDRSCLVEENGVVFRVLSLEDLLLHICVHGCHHLLTAIDLIPFCDLTKIIEKNADNIDWEKIIDRSILWGGQKGVYLMLLLARELLGAEVPDKILVEIKPRDYQPEFFNAALEQVFAATPGARFIRNGMGTLLKVKKNKAVWGKVTVILNVVFPTREYMARIYPISPSSPKVYLYYFIRLGRLSMFYTKMIFNLLRGDKTVMNDVRHGTRMGSVANWLFSPHQG